MCVCGGRGEYSHFGDANSCHGNLDIVAHNNINNGELASEAFRASRAAETRSGIHAEGSGRDRGRYVDVL